MDLGYNPFSDKPISITRHRHYNPSSDRGLFLHPTLAVFQCAAPAAVGMPIEMLGVSQCQKPRKMDGFSMKQKQRCGGQKLREITGAFEKKNRYDIPSPIGPMTIAMLDGRRLLLMIFVPTSPA